MASESPHQATRILVVDDDEAVLSSILRLLTAGGYQAEGCTTRAEGRERLREGIYRVLLLDRSFPDGDGLDLCRELRARHDPTPVLFLTALGEEADVVEGLDAGADDYVVKPVSWPILQARMSAILRRSRQVEQVVAGPITIDPVERLLTIRTPEGRLHAVLSPSELRLMVCLARSANRVVDRRAAIDAVWGPGTEVRNNAFNVLVVRLRTKLGPYARAMTTVRGQGIELSTAALTRGPSASDTPGEEDR